MKQAIIINLFVLCFTICARAGQDDPRIIHFPEDRAVARLMIRDIDPNKHSRFMSGWELLTQAQGDVTIPAGKQLRLEVYRDTIDISSISELGPNDLESLSLSNTNIIDDDFVHLKNLTGLLELDISSMEQINGSGLSHLKDFKSLKKLSCFNSNIEDSALEHISKMTSLEDLSLYMTQIDGAGLVHVKNLTSLKSLSLSKTSITDASLVHLKDMSWLKELRLYDTKIGDDGLAYLKGLTSLERLILGSIDRDSDVSPITDAGLAHLSTLTGLKSLGLYRTCITDEGLKHLGGLENLESLNLNKTKITGRGFAYLNRHAPLKGLELDEAAVTGEGLAALKPWSNTLENLDMDGIKLNDDDLVPLEDLKALKYINLRDSLITDAGLEHLKNITTLETLYFDRTKITDDGLMVLKDLPNLRTVSFTGTLVTNVGLESFKKASASKSFETNISLTLVSSREGGVRIVRHITPQPEAQPQPLIGKIMPDLAKMKTDIDLTQVNGKAILVCFWDMNQRPSRNCIQQLSKMAQELKEKDIAVIAIQATKIDKKTLEDWTGENEISLPIGMIKNDEEKTRFNWGVKSLPWLILTDKKHLIQAEGVSLEDINDILEKHGAN